MAAPQRQDRADHVLSEPVLRLPQPLGALLLLLLPPLLPLMLLLFLLLLPLLLPSLLLLLLLLFRSVSGIYSF